MTKAQIFKAAHRLTKEIIQKGDSYSATLGLCLSFIYANGLEYENETKEYKLYIPYSDKKDQKRAKQYLSARWNREGKYWMVNTSLTEIKECNLQSYLKSEEKATKENKTQNYAKDFFSRGFDYAEEGYTHGVI